MIANRIAEVLETKADALVRRAAGDLSALIHQDYIHVSARRIAFEKAAQIDRSCVSGEVLLTRREITKLPAREFPGFAVATAVLTEAFHFEGQDATASCRPFRVFATTAE